MAQLSSDILTPEVGALLRSARLAKGLSEDDVAARLRINRHYVERMDAGDIRSLPPEPYRKAFLKEYARLVGLKLDSLPPPPVEQKSEGILGAVTAIPSVAKKVGQEAASIAQSTVKTTENVVKKVEENFKEAVDEIRAKELWEEAEEVRRERLGIRTTAADKERELSIRRERPASATPPAPVPTPPPQPKPQPESPASSPERRTITQRLDLDKAVRSEAEQYNAPEYEEDEYYKPGMSRSTKIIVGLVIVIAGIIGYSVISKRSQAPPPVVTTQEVQKPAQAPVKTPPAAPKKADTTAQAAVAASDSTFSFSITAKDTVWISVTSDIGGGYRGKLKVGETKQFTAKDKYIVYLGNQKSVSMTLNGKPLSGLPTVPGSNMVVRNVLLTRTKAVPAPAEETPTTIQKAAKSTKEPVHTPPAKTTTPKHQTPVVQNHKPVVSTPYKKTKPAPKKQQQQGIKKPIPTTNPILPQPN